jgi:hypothetical protein
MHRRPASLLEFAIAASIAVVPVLVAVLLTVAWLRPVDSRVTRGADRHVSVRQVAALKTFEHAIVRRDKVTAGAPSAPALLDGVPACRAEWDGRGGPLNRARRILAHASDSAASPADRLSAQLQQLDDSHVSVPAKIAASAMRSASIRRDGSKRCELRYARRPKPRNIPAARLPCSVPILRAPSPC